MLEDSEDMEKKNYSRQSSVPPKANGSDSKKDNGSSKGQKSSRWKGNGGGGNFSYSDGSSRKPTPQKYRNTWDKRPRSRGGVSERQRDDLEEDPVVEYGSALKSGSKKGSLNHLLNFSYASPDVASGYRGGGSAGSWSRGRQVRYKNTYSRSSKVCYNKEQFLQANCQFVVKDGGDYSIHLMDPDSLVSWDAVEQVRVISHEPPSCPICLQYPIAAQMTRCGHIYCWACILHYLALGEKSWRKCPICYESILSSDLKSVVTKEVRSYKVGDTISMTLMKKEKGSIYAVPAVHWTKQEKVCHNVDDDPEVTQHVKLMTASPQQVLMVTAEERSQLEQQLKEAEPSEEAFIVSALSLLKEREELLTGAKEVADAVSAVKQVEESLVFEETPAIEPVGSNSSLGKKVKTYKSAFSDEEEEGEEEEDDSETKAEPAPEEETASEDAGFDPSIKQEGESEDLPMEVDQSPDQGTGGRSGSPKASSEPLAVARSAVAEAAAELDSFPVGSPDAKETPVEVIPDIMPVEEAAEHLELPARSDSANKTRNKSGEESFYFFQAADGQHIYLHSLNARCLVRQYGSLEHCPPVITASIVEKESVFVTEELRKRLRYLSHLPLTCGFEVAELALKPPVVDKEILKHFSIELEKRRRLRNIRQKQDKRTARRIDEEEKKKMGLNTGRIVHSQFTPGKPPPRASSNVPKPTLTIPADDARSEASSSSLDTPIGSPAGWNLNAPEFQPQCSVDSEEGDQTSQLSFAQMLKAGKKSTVWPKAKTEGGALSPVSPSSSGSQQLGSEDSDNEDKVPVPEFQSSFGSALEAAFVKIDAKTEASTSKTPAPSSGKKKKKQLMLFSTSMARGGK